MEPILGILGFLIALSVGFYSCQAIKRHRADQQAAWQGFEDRTRYRVQLSGHEPQEGPSDALVTIIEFSDYECPFCQRAHEPLMDALDDHDDVRLIFKHYPLPMHPNAIPAARAAWAAQQQGKFWEMHDHLFSVGGKLDDVEQVAERLGLDVERFRHDMVSEAAGEAIEADRYAAGRLGIGSTPHFVINGRHIRGALARNHWEKIIDSEREEAESLIAQGTPRGAIYEHFMKDAPAQRAKPRNGPDPDERHPITAGRGRPSLGPDDAPITVVEFSDFQCPFCARLAPTMHELVSRHQDVRVVFRQLPLDMHPAARPAAKAALAAHRQGKFWAMHDALFDKGGKLDADELEGIAAQIGLDMDQFGRDLEDPAIDQMIVEDETLARQVGVTGTPASFVNGRFIGGAQSVAAFDALIEQERTTASSPAEAEPAAAAGGG
ncbi:DsbA family protein [Paraliomyxa miuraensis]|uniref:DsbA family protein n=1 Tax=Paraliomyxa miuraensis TaxID=376150 RepID=UPI00225288F8|nr:thioredoxin domain-containing protein [Paraliomyxa miuraensis]MCX4239871.1 thioredoxin domain-containing protein [Paraliomyxa miuraensis]